MLSYLSIYTKSQQLVTNDFAAIVYNKKHQ